MADAEISVLIQAKDNLTATLKIIDGQLQKTGANTKKSSSLSSRMQDN